MPYDSLLLFHKTIKTPTHMDTPKFKDNHIIICDIPYPIKFGYRSYSTFIDRGNTQESMTKPTGLIELYYSGLVAGCERNNVPVLTKDEFLNALDDQEGLFEEIQKINTESSVAKK